MLVIEAVPDGASHRAQEQARSLFRAYGAFLRQARACGTFNFDRFDDEIRTLPAAYTGPGGQVLLASVDDAPVAVIAYRPLASETGTCEIKRLFVDESARGQGLARRLMTEVLANVTARGFERAILDTDVATMPEALALYRALGFTEYGRRDGRIAFFERSMR